MMSVQRSIISSLRRMTPMICRRGKFECVPEPGDALKPLANIIAAALTVKSESGKEAISKSIEEAEEALHKSKYSMKETEVVVPHPWFHGVFITGKKDVLATKNTVPGESVYGEKLISGQNKDGTMTEYRVWNSSRSKLAAAIVAGVFNIHIRPGVRVLYLGAASGTTVSHISDIIGPTGVVYAVEYSDISGRELANMAMKRTNVIPIIEDARDPTKYCMLVGMVDVIFSDVAQPDEARILALNASFCLKKEGKFVIAIKANCIDFADKVQVFDGEMEKLLTYGFRPKERMILEAFECNQAIFIGDRVPEKK